MPTQKERDALDHHPALPYEIWDRCPHIGPEDDVRIAQVDSLESAREMSRGLAKHWKNPFMEFTVVKNGEILEWFECSSSEDGRISHKTREKEIKSQMKRCTWIPLEQRQKEIEKWLRIPCATVR
jgi:hypothetical protein